MSAAVSLAREHGFPELRIEEIVEEAGFSVGTFYLYFDSKADLFVALVTDYTEQLRSRLESAYAGEGSVAQKLARGLEAYLDFVEENEKGFLYFVRAADSINTSHGRLSTWAFNIHAATLLPLLEEAMANGEMRDMDRDLVAQALVGLIQHLAGYWLEHADAMSRAQIRDFINSFTAFGLAPR
jgi:AcrR family transcriptional regulator